MSLVCLWIAGALYARVDTAEYSLRLPQADGTVMEEFHEAADAPTTVPHPRGGPYAAICADTGPCVSLDRLLPALRTEAQVTIGGCG